MASGLARHAPAEERSHAAGEAALHVEGRPHGADLSCTDDVWAAIEGDPRWTSPELAAIAAERGHAAAAAEAYRRHGSDLFRHLLGPFSLAVVEPAAGRALLAIDRFGIHRLCFAPLASGLAFGTTTESVRAHPLVGASIPAQAIHDFLTLGVCASPATIYAEQQKLLPAQFLVCERGEVRRAFYWRMPYREGGRARLKDLAAELQAVLRQAVRRAIAGEDTAHLGAFLSGGLDSSAVAGLAVEVAGRPIKTVTIGFEHDEFDEMGYAHLAAERFATEQIDYYLRPDDVIELLPRMAAAYDEPFGNSSAVPAYYCARTAGERGVAVMLAGDGGDEIFAGNRRYVEQKVLEVYQRLPRALRRGAVEPLLAALPGGERVSLLRKVRNYVQRSNIPMPERMEGAGPFAELPLEEVFAPELAAQIEREASLEGLREAYLRTPSADLVHRMMHLDLKITLADNDLRKVEQMCELAAMPVRYPLLDEEVVEFAARVPPELLIKGFRLRHFYKRALADFLPAEVLAKKKHGFGMPYGDWPRTVPRFRAFVRDRLASLRGRGLFRAAFLDHLDPAAPGSPPPAADALLWDLLTLELWLAAHPGVPVVP